MAMLSESTRGGKLNQEVWGRGKREASDVKGWGLDARAAVRDG